jgi:glycerol kinase
VLWNLAGVHATEPSNASRTMLFDIDRGAWSDELLELFGVPRSCLPDVRPSSGRFGITDPDRAAGLRVPVSGIAGDQQAALFGQACFSPGMTKNTYGTGSFVLVNLGDSHPPPVDGLLTTVAWQLGEATTYAMEGSIFVTGAAVQWLRDGLHLIGKSSEVNALAQKADPAEQVYLVPAFVGLGAPHWDPDARGLIAGLTLGSRAAHLARAALESVAYQTSDLADAMVADGAGPPAALRVDGGMAANDWLCQFLADILRVPVDRPAHLETTALGAAFLAGMAVGVWDGIAGVAALPREIIRFEPRMGAEEREKLLKGWRKAVERALLD